MLHAPFVIKSLGPPALWGGDFSLTISYIFYRTDPSSPPTQGTDIITLLNTVHYDPNQFLTPQEFNPEHFLDANQSFKKSPAFMPFSAGESHGDKSGSLGPHSYLHSSVLIPLSKPSRFFIPPNPQLWVCGDICSPSHLCSYID